MKKKFYNLVFKYRIIELLVISSFISGYLLREDGSGSGQYDFVNYLLPTQKSLNLDFLKTLEEGNFSGYTPLHYFLYYFVFKFFDFKGLLIINFFISFLVIYIFYNCLVLKFPTIKKNYLLLISLTPMIDPYFRSSSYWFQNEITSLCFFLFSLFYFIKYEKNKKKKYFFYLATIFAYFAIYAKQNLIFYTATLFIYAFYYFDWRGRVKISLLNLVLFTPFAIMFFYFKTLTPGAPGSNLFSFNTSNILIFFSILSFYVMPFIIFKFKYLINLKINYLQIIILFFVIFLIFLFFNYNQNIGGGIIYKISNILFKNNILVLIFSFIGVLVVYFNLKKFYFFNYIILILFNLLFLLLTTPFQEYFAIYFFYITFLLFDKSINDVFENFKKKILLIYGYFSVFLFGSILYNFLNLKILINVN